MIVNKEKEGQFQRLHRLIRFEIIRMSSESDNSEAGDLSGITELYEPWQ